MIIIYFHDIKSFQYFSYSRIFGFSLHIEISMEVEQIHFFFFLFLCCFIFAQILFTFFFSFISPFSNATLQTKKKTTIYLDRDTQRMSDVC